MPASINTDAIPSSMNYRDLLAERDIVIRAMNDAFINEGDDDAVNALRPYRQKLDAEVLKRAGEESEE